MDFGVSIGSCICTQHVAPAMAERVVHEGTRTEVWMLRRNAEDYKSHDAVRCYLPHVGAVRLLKQKVWDSISASALVGLSDLQAGSRKETAMGSRAVVEEIQLTRGPSGLGFNIVGGTDQQYVSHNDSGIYVSSIKENGAAAVDGRLQEGDRILEVNGIKLENLLHKNAVELFRNAGEHVVLKVQHQVR
ncbi:PREDICTED: discs large homolog 1-like protein [Nanorana parkeri]|uniref:discs large homolog 1-like protein n=1 Tax=Nanorana parkeri TaxID=125878 RepID=UPI0008546A9E|nr:PREDICTED: discs large homolog 1-like protein [Nanorana parkeri]